MKPLAECHLYTFVDSAYLHDRDPVQLARELCEGGSDLIQLRAKDWPMEKVRDIGRQILDVTSSFNARLVINDHLSIAQEIGGVVVEALPDEDSHDPNRDDEPRQQADSRPDVARGSAGYSWLDRCRAHERRPTGPAGRSSSPGVAE